MPHIPCYTDREAPDITRQGQVVGQRAPATSQREHHHRPGREQARPGNGAARQASHSDRGGRGIRQGGRPSLLRDVGQDGRERAGAVHRHRQETAPRPGRAAARPAGPATGRQPSSGGGKHPGRRALRVLGGIGFGRRTRVGASVGPLGWVHSGRRTTAAIEQEVTSLGFRAWKGRRHHASGAECWVDGYAVLIPRICFYFPY